MEPLALPKPKAIRQPTDFQRKIDSAVSGLEPGEVVSLVTSLPEPETPRHREQSVRTWQTRVGRSHGGESSMPVDIYHPAIPACKRND